MTPSYSAKYRDKPTLFGNFASQREREELLHTLVYLCGKRFCNIQVGGHSAAHMTSE